jgi:exodeoxyribonuclease VII large subunit
MIEIDSNTISVSELTQKIKTTLELGFNQVEVIGEISNYTAASSGHKYLTLKDNNAQISCVMWKSRPVNFQIENGMKVYAKGSITVYPPRGSYQLDIASIRPQGIGDLYLAYEKLKKELLELGYFSSDIKKPLPLLPQRIGVSTSPTGAAVRDIFSTLERRIPFAEIFFYPTMVQGSGSELEIAKAITELDKLNLDVIIIGRGGGSIEDLWSYNTKVVADAIFTAKTPIIAGVGHETDNTIADLVADLRAPTPTGAAEIVSINTKDIISQTLDENQMKLLNLIEEKLTQLKSEVDSKFEQLNKSGLSYRLDKYKINIDNKSTILEKQIAININRAKVALENYETVMKKVNPLIPLERGYAMLLKDDERVDASTELSVGDEIKIVRKTNTNKATIKE